MWRLADRQMDTFVADGRVRVHRPVRQPVRPAGDRRPARGPRGGPPEVRGGPAARDAANAERSGAPAATPWSTRRWSTSTSAFTDVRRGPPSRAPATTCSPGWRAPPSPTARPPRSSTSSASRPTCSPPGRRRPSGCSSSAVKILAEQPELQELLRSERDRIPNFIEETLRMESPVKGDFRLSRVPIDRRRRRPPGGHHRDAAQRSGQPRPPPLRRPGDLRRRPAQRPAPTSRSGGASTPARAHHSPGPRRG